MMTLASGPVMELSGACAIVTGGASGIGAATVARLRAAGARVAVLDVHDAPDADISLPCDVGDEEQVVASVAEAATRMGGLDVAVVNAGVGGMAPILELSTDEWDRVMRVNLRGGFVTLRECAARWSNTIGPVRSSRSRACPGSSPTGRWRTIPYRRRASRRWCASRPASSDRTAYG